ncbi:MAG: CYTH domain-containing protein [Prevotellaceae bacterium]|jgi:CYTH domain-containing protein|nr:CYTH domain-containing protein [Prevotellaceae bacterium]
MAKEIERKFLVKNLFFKELGVPHKIKQGYICTEKNRVVRVRLYDEQAFLTLKSASVGFSREEFEYEIPLKDAEIMLQTLCIQPVIEKTRWVIPQGKRKWEIDVFEGENLGLIIAEIELENEAETFKIPEFIDKEVTGDVRYYNSFINQNPYSKW